MVFKNLAVIGGTLSLIGMYIMGLLAVSWPIMMGIVCLSVIVLLVVNRR